MNKSLLICVLLVLATVAVFLPVANHEFIKYDDDVYVTDTENRFRRGETVDDLNGFGNGLDGHGFDFIYFKLYNSTSLYEIYIKTKRVSSEFFVVYRVTIPYKIKSLHS